MKNIYIEKIRTRERVYQAMLHGELQELPVKILSGFSKNFEDGHLNSVNDRFVCSKDNPITKFTNQSNLVFEHRIYQGLHSMPAPHNSDQTMLYVLKNIHTDLRALIIHSLVPCGNTCKKAFAKNAYEAEWIETLKFMCSNGFDNKKILKIIKDSRENKITSRLIDFLEKDKTPAL